jgi:hypothetical protein
LSVVDLHEDDRCIPFPADLDRMGVGTHISVFIRAGLDVSEVLRRFLGGGRALDRARRPVVEVAIPSVATFGLDYPPAYVVARGELRNAPLAQGFVALTKLLQARLELRPYTFERGPLSLE